MTECIESWYSGARPDIQWGGRKVRHYRVAWEDANQACLLPGTKILHTCDNGRCINPKHLVAGSQGDNMRDMARKGRAAGQLRTHCPKGHALTGDNVLVRTSPKGKPWRGCRECGRIDALKRYHAKKAGK